MSSTDKSQLWDLSDGYKSSFDLRLIKPVSGQKRITNRSITPILNHLKKFFLTLTEIPPGNPTFFPIVVLLLLSQCHTCLSPTVLPKVERPNLKHMKQHIDQDSLCHPFEGCRRPMEASRPAERTM